jgi:signal transduction histidine kinase
MDSLETTDGARSPARSSGSAAPEEDPADGSTSGSRSLRERLTQFAATTDGSTAEDGLGLDDQIDRVAAFASAVLVIRWGTTIASLALAAQDITQMDLAVAAWCVIIIVYALFRTVRPIRYTGDVRSLAAVVAEVAMFVLALAMTGYWDSPFVFTLLTAITVAGFARGFGFAIRISVLSSLAVSIPFLIDEDSSTDAIRTTSQWSLVMVLVALIAGYSRRISGEADRQHSLALDRLGRLADANALLFSLHRVTQTLPASLDLNEVLDTTIGRLKGLFDLDFAAVMAYDDTEGGWEVLRKEGGRLPARFDSDDLPPIVRRVASEQAVVAVPDLPTEGGPGLGPKATSGIYAPLVARGSLIGILVVEHHLSDHFSARDVELLKGFVEPVALAIDNARWFARLRTVGADEERTRIARDLHDRIGQSLAYLAFELDRIVGKQQQGEELGGALEQLRDDVRGVIREVRDTLYDLRTDVSDSQDLPTVLEQFVPRVRERSGLRIQLFCDRDQRLPILQEREMWRIAQEALTNVERHARATDVMVIWRYDGDTATLEVTDNGRGFPTGRAGRLDSYGIMGMRERASSIGATLEITSQEGAGTRVRATLVRVGADLDAVSAGSDR